MQRVQETRVQQERTTQVERVQTFTTQVSDVKVQAEQKLKRVQETAGKQTMDISPGQDQPGQDGAPGEADDLLALRMEDARAKFFHSMMVDSEKRRSSSSAHRTGTSVLPLLGKVSMPHAGLHSILRSYMVSFCNDH